MAKHTRSRIGALAMAVALTGAMTACGGSDDAAATGGQKPARESGQEAAGAAGSSKGDDGDNGRAFDSADEAVVVAMKAATRSDDVEWVGSTIVITFDEGSAEDPSAWLMCGPATAVIAAEESARLVYPDGQLDCDDRPGY